MNDQERLQKFLGAEPQIDATAYIASSATIVGDVRIGPHASIWYNCVLRGDINSIEVGEASNIQDGSVVHLADDYGVKIGAYVTIGHMAMIHACSIADECLIGMHATILDGAEIGAQSIIGAHALVTQHTKIPPGSLVLGMPAKVVRQLTKDEILQLHVMAEKYIFIAAAHKAKFIAGKQFF
ncbi:MAG: gamma carbonic anhydrase family protein [Deltaproteobacteria bacterium]|nr:gamma carbonic anhydrase family protein [Deltaproteobacteria bacterium]